MRTYVPWNPRDGEAGGKGYPAGPRLFYECVRCGAAVRSEPAGGEPWECRCGGVHVDPPQGRVGVWDNSQLRIFEDDQLAIPATDPNYAETIPLNGLVIRSAFDDGLTHLRIAMIDELESGYEIMIRGRFLFSSGNSHIALQDTAPIRALVDGDDSAKVIENGNQLRPLVGGEVSAIRIGDDGTLELRGVAGFRIVAPMNPDLAGWFLFGPDGRYWIGGPGTMVRPSRRVLPRPVK